MASPFDGYRARPVKRLFGFRSMGIGIVLIFWALVGGIITGCYVLLRHARKNTVQQVSIVQSGGLILGGVILAPIFFLIIGGVSNSIQSFFPNHLYEAKFGYPPPSDVTELEGNISTFGDSSAVVLRFRANPQTVEKILSTRFTEIDKERFVNHSAFDGTLNNGNDFTNQTTRYYEASNFDKTYGSSSAILSYDEPARAVCFYWLGID